MVGALEQLNRFNRAIDDIIRSNADFLHERAQKLALYLSESGIELPRGADDANSETSFTNLVAKVDRRHTQTQEVQLKFDEAFKRLTSLRTSEVDRVNVASLTDSQCRQALLLACKMLDSSITLEVLETGLKSAFSGICGQYTKQFVRLEEEARACVKKIAKLWNKENDTFLKKISKMEDELQKRTAELARLARRARRAEKAAKDRYALKQELENIKTSLLKDDEEVAELRRQLAQSETDLCTLRASSSELSEKLTDLEEQLAECVAYGKAAAAKVADVEEKRRCSICMDRPKDTVFACGHTCCGQCAREWKKCYYNCQSERRQKPVKYSFPIYL